MNYVKLTPEKFLEKLKNEEYKDLTGSRRAIGKTDWSENKKNEARAAAEKFFGTSGTKATPVKKTAGKAPVKKSAAPKAAPAVKKAAAAPKVPSPKVMLEHQAPPHAQGGRQITLAEVRKNPYQAIQLAEHGVQSGTSALNALNSLKKENPAVDIAEPANAAIDTLRHSLHLISLVTKNISDGMVPHVISEAVKATVSLNGTTEQPDITPPGEPVYTGPAAEA